MTHTLSQPGSARLTGGETLVASLAAHKVDTVFGIPGTHNLEIYRHLAAAKIRHVTTRHEQGAGYAADGYARTSGRPGVALVTTGPALLNITAALAQAYSDSVPVLAVSPGMPLRHPQRGTGLLHEMRDQRAALANIVRYSHRVSSHAELTEAVAQIFADFAAERPRPVHLEIPLDLLAESAEVNIAAPLRIARRRADEAQIIRAATLLNGAQRPGILAGGGARGAAAQVIAIAELLHCGVLTTANGKGVIPENHPLSLGAAAHLPTAGEWLADRDVLLAIGTEMAPSDFWYEPPTPRGEVIRIDLDPTQLLINARPALPICGDATAALEELLPLLKAADGIAEQSAASGVQAKIRAEARAEGARWTAWMDALAGALPKRALVLADNAMAGYYGALGNLPVHEPGAFGFPTGFGTLGYALPAAIGAKVARPRRPVVALCGDGGLMFSCQEIATAAAEGVALPIVVFVNGGYGEIRAEMRAASIDPIGVDLPVPDLIALATALGGAGFAVRTPDELRSLVKASLEHPGPTLLVVEEEVP
ncbi:MAG: 5-guanidino-2-oxopentanoate decarboxylase [Hamadaea sp.]|uniref:5-guanidino-2-oxopentanoate decarboxylase n=1 Tax=Hamadaea sp. NPDC050747 TaxID=3155789 RepID=UPI001809BAEF|nr:5-guanidino-2-oxopentanoate decarboxylase [Hamadaea sp.]NUR46562.1 5-guanidino-2-oxopentanoate decarboxylase [Hamadaea sp.]NUT07628.1 5-guanidino-2-oxopentanoate decarboxylase [Hamadaea sp.]